MTLRAKMLAVMQDVSDQVAEREELIELIAIALLTGNNLFILGKPGQAKSLCINLFCRHITGARQFERLLSKQTDEDQLFGRIDLSSLIPGGVPDSVLKGDGVYENLRFDLQCVMDGLGRMKNTPDTFAMLEKATDKLLSYRKAVAALHQNEPVVQTSGKIPEADIVFLDEIFKANEGVLNSLLTVLNERKYTNEGHTYTIPAISFFAASNEIPDFSDPQEQILAPLYDRLQIKVMTEDISDRSRRMTVLMDKQSGKSGSVNATITLDELCAMQQEVSAVPVPEAINELADDVLCELRKNGVIVSDRKYLNYYPLAQAKAWLEGHDKVTSQDLLILTCYLWQQPEDRQIVERTLTRLCVNPLQDKVHNILSMAAEAQEDFNTVTAGNCDPKAGSKALLKLRGELLRLYKMQQTLAADTQSDSERDMTDNLLKQLETISKTAHNAVNFTYIPLEQMAALQ